MSSPLDRIEARLASATRHGHGGNGSWVYRTSDVLALVNVAKAAEPMAKLPAPITADERQEWIIRQNALREELAVLDKEQT